MMSRIIDTRTKYEKKRDAYLQAKTHEEKLCVAAKYGDLLVLKECIKAGARVNPGPGKATPLYWAVVGREFTMVKILVEEYYADVNGINTLYGQAPHGMFNTPLHASIEISDKPFEIVDYLLSKGANPNVKDQDDETPLHNAASKAVSFIDIAETFIMKLIIAGADPQLKSRWQQYTPLEYGQWHINNNCRRTSTEKTELISRLGKALAFKPKVVDSYGIMLHKMPSIALPVPRPSPAVPRVSATTSEVTALRDELNEMKKENAALRTELEVLKKTYGAAKPPSPRATM